MIGVRRGLGKKQLEVDEMGPLLAVLGGILAGTVLKRVGTTVSTRFIFNVVIFAVVVAQTVLFFFKTVLPAGGLLSLLLVLWGMDMAHSWESGGYF
jgi:hypothetical protein